MYVAHLCERGIKHNSVKVYLAAVRSLHIELGYDNPLSGCQRLTRAVKAISITSEAPKQKLPITLDILFKIEETMNDNFDSNVLWAAMTLAHFGCLRAGELTVPSVMSFDPLIHLSVGDVNFSQLDPNTPYMSVFIKRSKTDKSNKGFNVYIGCSGTNVCALCAVKKLLSNYAHRDLHLPLFEFSNHIVLTKSLFVKHTRTYMSLIGLDPKQFSGHSYRSGGATSAAAAGLSDWEVKLLGRWTSDAYTNGI
jgi:hypothetical protein